MLELGACPSRQSHHRRRAQCAAALRAAPELRRLVRFNEFALCVEFTRESLWREAKIGEPWTDDDDLSLQAWLQEREVEVRQRGIVTDSVAAVAKDNTFHPVREYFNQPEWDQHPRLDRWLADLLHAEGPPQYLRAVGNRFPDRAGWHKVATVGRGETRRTIYRKS